MTESKLYCLPSLARGNGTGHLMRCAWIVETVAGGILCLPEAGLPGFFTADEVESVLGGRLGPERIRYAFPDEPSPIILLDRRECDDALWNSLPRGCRIIGIDEGGPLRRRMDYLFDTLPGRRYPVGPHQGGPFLLPGPDHRRSWPEKLEKLLITFGGEDPAHLAEKTLKDWEALHRVNGTAMPEIWICQGFLSREIPLPSWVRPLPPTGDLKNRLADFDLVITSYGLTAFESLRAGVPVVIRDPSRYHRSLTAGAGLPSLRRGGANRLRPVLREFSALVDACRRLSEGFSPGTEESLTLTDRLERLSLPAPFCPGCGHRAPHREDARRPHRILGRFPDRSFRRCGRCGLVYQLLHRPAAGEYGEEYFFEEYARQYGKTYLEDFPHLRFMARSRLNILKSFLPEGARLLDIGCAYGAFLLEARDAGYDAFGIDVASSAVEYVTGELGLEAKVLPVEALKEPSDFGRPRIEGITLWYVIEHIPSLQTFLRTVSGWQREGDILAFSTPNARGISGRRDLRQFLSRSPHDHHHIWSPRIARSLLALYGYRVRKVRVTGHHPERFPGMARRGSSSPLFCFCGFFSRLAGWGDTFEIYAEKVREKNLR